MIEKTWDKTCHMGIVCKDGSPTFCVLSSNNPSIRSWSLDSSRHMRKMHWPQSHIFLQPMLSQNFPLFLVVIFFIHPLLFQLLISNNGLLPENIVAKIDQLQSSIEPYRLKQPLPGNLVEPVEFQTKRHEENGTNRIFNCPLLPLQPKKIELERKHFNLLCVSVYSICICL